MSKDKSIRVLVKTPIGGERLAATPGDYAYFPEGQAKRLEAIGAVEIVTTKLASLKKMARELDYSLVPNGEGALVEIAKLARQHGYFLADADAPPEEGEEEEGQE